MPGTEIPNDEHYESASSLTSTPPLRRNQQFMRGNFLPHSISSDSSIEIDPELENILNIEPLPLEPLYVPIVLPVEPTFEELLHRVAGRDDLHNVESIKLRVISYMVSLQRLPIFMPKLSSLNLEGSVVGSLRDLGCGLVELKYLNVSNCGLRSLDGTNGLPGLETLVADCNMIENVGPCCNLTELKRLSLKENQIKDMGNVSFLAMCPFLKELNLRDNPITSGQGYRQNIKKYIATIEILDGTALTDDTNGDSPEANGVQASYSSTSSLESASSLSTQETSDYDLNFVDYSQIPSTSQKAFRQIQSDWADTSLANEDNAVRGTILNKARRRRKSKLHSPRVSSANSNSSSSCEMQFPDKLPQDNVELELGVIGGVEDDIASNISEVSVDSLQQIIEKWKLECKRKKEANC